MSYREDTRIPGDHPSLRGHFPDNPVVPAVVLLDMVCQALKRWRPGIIVIGVPMAKFQSRLLPEQPFEIALAELSAGRVGFRCSAGDRLLARGRLDYRRLARA